MRMLVDRHLSYHVNPWQSFSNDFYSILYQAKWLGNITKEHAVRKIEKLGSNLVTCREFISDEELESYYNGFELASGPLKSNKKNITRFLAQVRTRKFHNPNNVTDKDNCGKFLLSDDMYEPSQNYLRKLRKTILKSHFLCFSVQHKRELKE